MRDLCVAHSLLSHASARVSTSHPAAIVNPPCAPQPTPAALPPQPCRRRYTGGKKAGVDAYLAPELARCPSDCVAYTPAGKCLPTCWQTGLLCCSWLRMHCCKHSLDTTGRCASKHRCAQLNHAVLPSTLSHAPGPSRLTRVVLCPAPCRRHVVLGRGPVCAAQRQPRAVWQPRPVLDLHPQHARPARKRGQAAKVAGGVALGRATCTLGGTLWCDAFPVGVETEKPTWQRPLAAMPLA